MSQGNVNIKAIYTEEGVNKNHDLPNTEFFQFFVFNFNYSQEWGQHLDGLLYRAPDLLHPESW